MNIYHNLKPGETISQKIVNAIRTVAGEAKVALHEPIFKGNEWSYLKDCLDSGYVSSIGQYVEQFENQVCEFTGSKYAVAVVSGTAALHLGLLVGGIKPNEEVLIPSLTFIATANAVSYCGAVPHFVDVSEVNLGIDAKKLRTYLRKISIMEDGYCINKFTGRPIKAVVPMHVFGHPCDLKALLEVSDEFNIIVIEDAAEAIGSFYQNKHVGTFGKLGILSFNGNKTITTGGGGMILTDDIIIAEKAKHLSTTSKKAHPFKYFHDDIGFNYRMPNLNAALGCAQLEQLPNMLSKKRELFKIYFEVFSDISDIEIFKEPFCCRSNYWLQTLLLNEKYMKNHEDIITSCIEAGINVRPAWTPLHQLPVFDTSPASPMLTTSFLVKRIINIPSGVGLI